MAPSASNAGPAVMTQPGPARPSGNPAPDQTSKFPLPILGLALGMVLLGLIPIPTAALFARGAGALEISAARGIVAAMAAVGIAIVIIINRAIRGKILLTKDSSPIRVTCAALGVGIIFFGSGYAYIAALQAGLHVAYTLLTVSAVAMIVARCLEANPVSDRFVFSLTMALVTLSMILGTNVTVDPLIQASASISGFLLAACSGVAFGMLPRAFDEAKALDSTLLLAVGFLLSAIAHVLVLAIVATPIVLLPSILSHLDLANPDLAWTLLNGLGCTYMPYALTNWAKRRGVTDSVMAVGYQLEPIVATMIAAPMIGQPVPPNVSVGVLFAVVGFLLFSMHEAKIRS